MRSLSYAKALSEGLVQAMEKDPDIFITGIAVDYPSGIFGSTVEAATRYGPSRVFESPAMENAITGIAVGAALVGKRAVIVHPRNDFMFLSLDMLLNMAAKWRYMFGGNGGHARIVVRAVIGKGWGQGASHSQSLQATLAHFPGLAVVMPATPRDAKGLILSALQADGPVVVLEHRSLYDTVGEVPEEMAPTPIGKAAVALPGADITIVATSLMVVEALNAAAELAKSGIGAEVIDLRSIRPLDEATILESVKKTGRLVVVDTSWELCGVASEIAALAVEKAFVHLKAPVRRISLADCPAPVSMPLEAAFYPTAKTVAGVCLMLMEQGTVQVGDINFDDKFKGPY